ncbi:hypothetical protein ACTFIV_009766 [Dictyostelium citrinum]
MNKINYYILGFIGLLFIVKQTHSQGPFPYNTTLGCSFYGFNDNFAMSTYYQPYRNVILEPNTCQQSHPEYSETACCTTDQLQTLSQQMIMSNAIFGVCSACLDNIWSLWCASSCSPFQQSFMVPTSVNPSNDQINDIDFVVHPDFGEGLYESCAGIYSDGAPPFGKLYPNKELFFNGIFGLYNPTFKINFIFNATGYNSLITPCSQSCSCDYCPSAC